MLSCWLLLVAGCSLAPQVGQRESSLLTVQAEARVNVNPDQVQLRLGVVTEAETAGSALEQNNQRMRAVMEMLAENGLGSGEMATGQFRVSPEWSRPPRPTPANWQREIIGYRVNNELLVSTTRVELAGTLLSLAQQSGANLLGGLQFGLVDPTVQRQQAIELAVSKARRKAQAMAAAAGVELGPLQTMRLDEPGTGPQRLMLAEARTAAEPVPVAAGKVEVTAAVTMVYRLLDSRQ